MALNFWLFKRTRWVFWALAVMSAVSFVASVVITPTAQPMAFFILPTRAWELGVASVLARIVFFSAQTAFPGYMAAISVAHTAAVIVSGAGTQTPAWATQRFLSIRPLVFIGLISYSIYQIHWPLIQLTRAAGSLACVLVATDARVAAGTRPESVAEAAPAFVASIDPVGTGFVPSNLDPELTAAMTDYSEALADGCNVPLTGRTPTNCVYGDPEAPRLALFGDSHALHAIYGETRR